MPLAKLCAWFGVPRRTIYYKPTKAAPKVDPRFADLIKAMIEAEPSFGYRTVAWLLGFNKNAVQRIFQIKGWQVCKRSIGMRPRIEALLSVATVPNERWSTDLCRVWAGRDGWTTLALVIDCHTRELDTRNNRGFGDVIGRGAALCMQDDRLCGQIVRCALVLMGLSAVSEDFRRSYPVAAHRSWKIRRSKL